MVSRVSIKKNPLETATTLGEVQPGNARINSQKKLKLLKLELLKKIDLFRSIPSDTLSLLVDQANDIYLTRDSVLFKEETDYKNVYVILSGKLLVYKGKKNISELGQGEYVGEMPLIDQQSRSASVKAVEDTLLMEIDEDLFKKSILPNSSALLAMMRVFANRMRDDLTQMESEMRKLSNFTHDMQNCLVPLGTAEIVLEVALEIMCGTKPYHKKREGWDKIQKGSNTLMAVKNNLMTLIDQSLACIRKTKSEYIKSSFDLVSLVEETAEEISCHKKLKGKILNVIKPKAEVRANLNYLDIKRVLQNLIINAGYATQKGQKITISIKQLSDRVEVHIEDEGEGIPEDIQPLLLNENITTKPDGNGFGLMSCKEIIEKHHKGKIGFQSEVNKGTNFYFTLPYSSPN